MKKDKTDLFAAYSDRRFSFCPVLLNIFPKRFGIDTMHLFILLLGKFGIIPVYVQHLAIYHQATSRDLGNILREIHIRNPSLGQDITFGCSNFFSPDRAYSLIYFFIR